MSPAATAHLESPSAEAMKPGSRSCSLRSTQLTASSVSTGSAFEPACFGEWVYWQRDCERNPECWTKVFAVVLTDDASICLHQCEDMSKRTLVCRRGLWSVRVTGNRRRIKLVDAQGAVIMRLWLMNHANHALWKTCLENAVQVAALAPPAEHASATNQSIVSSLSSLSFRRCQEVPSATRVSKRSLVKAVCREAVTQIKSRLHGATER